MNAVEKIKKLFKGDKCRYSFKIKSESAQKFEELSKVYGMNKTKLFEKLIDDSISPIHYAGGNMISSKYTSRVRNGVLTNY